MAAASLVLVNMKDLEKHVFHSFLMPSNLHPNYDQSKNFHCRKQKGDVTFYFLTINGVLVASARESDLGNNRVPLSPLFHKAHEVITQARLVNEKQKRDFHDLMNSATTGDVHKTKNLTEIAHADPLQSQMNTAEIQLTYLRNQRDALYQSLWDKVKRVRSSIKGIYGDDSTEYEMVGRTRLSERKPTVRKSKATA